MIAQRSVGGASAVNRRSSAGTPNEMFQHVGQTNETSPFRTAQALVLTVLLGGAVTSGMVWVQPDRLFRDLADLDEEERIIEVVMADPVATQTLIAPAPPPRPPPPPEEELPEEELVEEEEEEPEEAEEMVEPEEPPEEPPKRIKARRRDPLQDMIWGRQPVRSEHAGVDLLGGQGLPVEATSIGASELDPDNATLVRANALDVRSRVRPKYPAAFTLGLDDPVCNVRVSIDELGMPYKVRVEDCPAVFHASARDALFKWRWEPPIVDGEIRRAETVVAVRYVR